MEEFFALNQLQPDSVFSPRNHLIDIEHCQVSFPYIALRLISNPENSQPQSNSFNNTMKEFNKKKIPVKRIENLPCISVVHASKQLQLSCSWTYPLQQRIHL
jgi:hypothetical protein